MDRNFRKIVLDNSDVIVQKGIDEIETLKGFNYTDSVSDELLESTNREFVNIIFNSIKDQGDTQHLKEFFEKLINLGCKVSYITDGLQVCRRVTMDFILKQTDQINTGYISELFHSVDEWVDPLIRQLVNEYSGNWENILS